MDFLSEKKILVTGATGLIGSSLVNELVKAGALVIAGSREKEKLIDIFKSNRSKNLTLRAFDVVEKVPEDIGEVDFIFHAASPVSGKDIRRTPVDTINVNITGVRNCFEYLKRQKEKGKDHARMIIFSSATVYGNARLDERIVYEDDTEFADSLDSENAPYSESKRMMEVISYAYGKQYAIDSVIARIGWVYGFSKNMPDTAFYEFIKKAAAGENIVLNHSGMGRRDNIYVADVVKALILLARSGKPSQAYNISSGGDMDNYKAIDEIAEYIAYSINKIRENTHVQVIVPNSSRKREPGVILCNDKIKELGWTVETKIQDGIQETIEQYINKEII